MPILKAEKKLLKMYPNCAMYGADPSKEAGVIFKEVGQYFEFGVGNRTGNYTNVANFGGGYYPVIRPTVELTSFLKDYVKQSLIDFFWVDNEGPEYDLAPYLKKDGSLDAANITICQINMEFHEDKGAKDGFLRFANVMPHIVNYSNYLPLVSNTEFNNNRIFFVNANDMRCVEKYFATASSKDCNF